MKRYSVTQEQIYAFLQYLIAGEIAVWAFAFDHPLLCALGGFMFLARLVVSSEGC